MAKPDSHVTRIPAYDLCAVGKTGRLVAVVPVGEKPCAAIKQTDTGSWQVLDAYRRQRSVSPNTRYPSRERAIDHAMRHRFQEVPRG